MVLVGAKSASDEEYKELYRFSLDYLKNEKNCIT
jgi:hypothetical protein